MQRMRHEVIVTSLQMLEGVMAQRGSVAAGGGDSAGTKLTCSAGVRGE